MKLKRFLHAALYTANPLIFMGALWQLEIADLALIGNYPFRFLFNTLTFHDVWAVRDFWMLTMLTTFLLASAQTIHLLLTRKNKQQEEQMEA